MLQNKTFHNIVWVGWGGGSDKGGAIRECKEGCEGGH
jgi:hypothetical protein